MRLIDADELQKQFDEKCIKDCEFCPLCLHWINDDLERESCCVLIQRAPTIDAVPVVRCRDCKYAFQNNGYDKEGCPIMDRRVWMDGNSFCSEGKRMDGEAE